MFKKSNFLFLLQFIRWVGALCDWTRNADRDWNQAQGRHQKYDRNSFGPGLGLGPRLRPYDIWDWVQGGDWERGQIRDKEQHKERD